MRATAEGEKTFRMDSLFAQWQEPRTKQAKEVERNGTYECVWAELPPPPGIHEETFHGFCLTVCTSIVALQADMQICRLTPGCGLKAHEAVICLCHEWRIKNDRPFTIFS